MRCTLIDIYLFTHKVNTCYMVGIQYIFTGIFSAFYRPFCLVWMIALNLKIHLSFLPDNFVSIFKISVFLCSFILEKQISIHFIHFFCFPITHLNHLWSFFYFPLYCGRAFKLHHCSLFQIPTKLIKKKRKKNQIRNMRNENGDITTDLTDE